MRSIGIYISALFCLALSFFCFIRPVDATVSVFSYWASTTNNYLKYSDGWRYAGQYLPDVAVNNLASYQWKLRVAIPYSQTIRVCHGTPNPTDYADWIAKAPTCNWPGNELIYSTTTTPGKVGEYYFVDFHDPIPLTIGDDYYVVVQVDNTVSSELAYCAGCGTGLILGPGFTGPGSMVYSAYYDDSYEPNPVYVYDISAGFSMADNWNCCDGSYDCIITGSQAALAPATEYTIYSGACASWPWEMTKVVASGTIPAYTSVWDEIIATTTGQWDLCYTSDRVAQVGLDTYHYIVVNPFTLTVAPATSTECAFPAMPDWCDYPCQGIATTTFGGEIQCGIQGALAWSFCVSSSSMDSLKSSAYMLRSKFPFSVWYSLIDTGKAAINDYDGGDAVFRFPMMSAATTSVVMTPVLDASSTQDLIGHNNASLFRTATIWVWYGILAAIFGWIVWPKKK
jgi:hypothetical protein